MTTRVPLTVPLVRSAYNHHSEVSAVVHAEVVDGRLEEVSVLLQPLWEVDRLANRHCKEVSAILEELQSVV